MPQLVHGIPDAGSFHFFDILNRGLMIANILELLAGDPVRPLTDSTLPFAYCLQPTAY